MVVEPRIAADVVIFADQRLFLRAVENLVSAVQHADRQVLIELTRPRSRSASPA